MPMAANNAPDIPTVGAAVRQNPGMSAPVAKAAANPFHDTCLNSWCSTHRFMPKWMNEACRNIYVAPDHHGDVAANP